ncbi:MAG: Fpg/Nei family DNA glycosylase [Gemmatimonadota bacterium]
MPELPDILVYLDCLRPRIVGRPLERVTLRNAFVLRSVTPAVDEIIGCRVVDVGRTGKRIVLHLEPAPAGERRFIVIHLMIAGRLKWRPPAKRPPGTVLAEFGFPGGTLFLTEAGRKRRASLHLVSGEAGLAAHDRGGLDVTATNVASFIARLKSENHTLKRALTDPRLIDGIGNAYADEILHAARLSPLQLTAKLTDTDAARLFDAARHTLSTWTERLRAAAGDGFPESVTAFREGFAVHGRFRQPCPACGTTVQRIRYADHETNYCPRCQTGGRLLADRALSRLLTSDWPRTLDD